MPDAGVGVIRVTTADNAYRQTARGSRNDRGSRFVRQQFESEGGTVNYFAPAAGVPGLGDPSLPKFNGSAEKFLGFVDRDRNSTAKLRRQMTKNENSRLTFAQGKLRDDGPVDRLEGLFGGQTEHQRR